MPVISPGLEWIPPYLTAANCRLFWSINAILFVADQYVNTNFFSISPVGSQINYRVSDDSTRTLSLVGETNLAPEGITLQNGTPCLLITSRSQLQKFTGDLQPYHTEKLCVQSKRDEVFVRDAQKFIETSGL